MDDKVRVRASIRFLTTEEGGRALPLAGGVSYRPNHNFFGPDDQDMCMGFIDLPPSQHVSPGETIQADIDLLIYPAVKPEIRAGKQWRIQEGDRLAAMGTILKVLDPLL